MYRLNVNSISNMSLTQAGVYVIFDQFSPLPPVVSELNHNPNLDTGRNAIIFSWLFPMMLVKLAEII